MEIQDAKNRHFGTITQLRRAISSELRHVSTIGKKLVKQQYLPFSPISSQCGELWPTSGWDLLASLRHPCKFQWVLRLGSVTARHSSNGRQPNCAALSIGRHPYSAGRPSRWALAHISSLGFELLLQGGDTGHFLQQTFAVRTVVFAAECTYNSIVAQ